MDAVIKRRVKAELRSAAEDLIACHDRITVRHFSANEDAGTISDVRNSSIVARVWPDFVVMEDSERTGLLPWHMGSPNYEMAAA